MMDMVKFFSPTRTIRNALLRWILACFLSIGLHGASMAGEGEEEASFSLRGFGSLGAARTTTDDSEYIRELTQGRGVSTNWDARLDSVLGLQANWQVRPDLEMVVQGISRYQYDYTYRPQIAWAYARYNPSPNLTVRAGRLATEFFLQADSRMVGYSYLTVRPINDYFWYLPFSSIDGGDVSLALPVGEDVVRGKAFMGWSTGKIPYDAQVWNIGRSPLLGGYLEYLTGPWLFRASYANIRFATDMPLRHLFSGFPDALTDASLDFIHTRDTLSHYYAVSAVYDRGPWYLQIMLNHIIQGARIFESSDSGYVLGGYRVRQFTPYLGYSWIRSHSRQGAPNPLVQIIMNDSHADQRTLIAGLRWDFAPDMAVKLQWDGVRGDKTSVFTTRRERVLGENAGNYNVFSVVVDFVF